MKSFNSLKTKNYILMAFLFMGLSVMLISYKYKIAKRQLPDISFWEWYWGFSK